MVAGGKRSTKFVHVVRKGNITVMAGGCKAKRPPDVYRFWRERFPAFGLNFCATFQSKNAIPRCSTTAEDENAIKQQYQMEYKSLKSQIDT